MEETSEELPNYSIDINLLGLDPTSNKNETERHSLGTKKGHHSVNNNI